LVPGEDLCPTQEQDILRDAVGADGHGEVVGSGLDVELNLSSWKEAVARACDDDIPARAFEEAV
jgi:hypothetical protein